MPRRLIIGAAALLLVCVALVLGRNYELDSAAVDIKTGNGAAAVRKLKLLATLGDRNAQLLLGYQYAYGWGGIARNDDEAMYWFSRTSLFGARQPSASDHKGASEALSVARTYAAGAEGVRADPEESKKWLHLAVRAGSEEAAAELSRNP